MAIATTSRQRSTPTWEDLHAFPSTVHHDDVTRWIDDVPADNAPRSAKRQQLLRDPDATSQHLNVTNCETENMASPTRRSRRNQRTHAFDADARNTLSHPSISQPSLSAPASSLRSLSPSKKKTASKKEDLAYLNPSIEFHSLRDMTELDMVLPQSVTDLWSRCENRRHDPITNDPPIPLNKIDLDRINDTLSDVFEQAVRWRDVATESHWNSIVVGPILHLLRRVEAFQKTTVPNAKVAVLDVACTEISPVELVPFSKDASLYRDLDKRIDYAVGLDLRRATVKTLRCSRYHTLVPSINQTASFANLTAIFLNIEVKRRHVARDPTIQLAAWVAAEFTKRRYEGWDLNFPVFTIEIDGDAWYLRVATARVNPNKHGQVSNVHMEEETLELPEDEYELFFFGPLALGDTLTIKNSEKLLANLLDITKWGQCDYRAWWEVNVLKILEEQI